MKLVRSWRDLRDSRRLDRESRDELAHHVELAVAEKVRAGLTEEQARRQVRLDLGNPEAARETLHDARVGSGLDSLVKDAAYAWRTLRHRPAFATACVLTIALGVGGSTALFAVVDAVVLRPLPLPDPDRLVRIYDTNPAAGVARTRVTSGNLADWRRRARSLRGLAGHYTMGRTLTLGADSEVVLAAQVTADFFAVMGVPAAVGRTFTAEETAASRFNSAAAPIGADPVLVISHALWLRRFGADPGVVGRTVTLERRPFRILGVMPASFTMPEPDVQVYLPWGFTGAEPRDQHYLYGVARLGADVSLAQAEDELDRIAEALAAEHPATNAGWSVQLVPLREDMVGDAGRTLVVLLGAVGLLLLVACANVALLSLARGLERGHEASIRLALGATRRRLLRQFLMESLLVCAAGGLLGALLALGGLALLARTDAGLPRFHEVAIDWRALAFACGATAAATLLSGLPAAWRRARGEPAAALAGTPARVASGGNRWSLRDGLVVAEVAMAVVLVAGASLLLRSYQRLQAVDPGFDPRGVLIAPIFLDMQGYGQDGKSRTYYAQLIERLEALPGVVSAGAATALPASPLGPDFDRPVWPEGTPEDERLGAGVGPHDHPALLRYARHADRRGARVRRAGRTRRRAHRDREPRPGPLAVARWKRRRPAAHHRLQHRGQLSPRRGRRRERRPLRGSAPGAAPRALPRARAASLSRDEHGRPCGRRSALPGAGGARGAARPGPDDATPRPERAHGPAERDLRARPAGDAGAVGLRRRGGPAVAPRHPRHPHAPRARADARDRHPHGGGRGPRARAALECGYALRLVLAGIGVGGALAAASARLVSGLLFEMGVLDPAPLLAVAGLALVALLVSLHPAWRATRIDAAEVLRAG